MLRLTVFYCILSGEEVFNMKERITQTAGRQQLGDFAPMFAHLNDDVLFGEVWNEEAIDVKTKFTTN